MTIDVETTVCPRCHGEGWVRVPASDPLSVPGQVDLDTCPLCHGRELTKSQLRRWARDHEARENATTGGRE